MAKKIFPKKVSRTADTSKTMLDKKWKGANSQEASTMLKRRDIRGENKDMEFAKKDKGKNYKVKTAKYKK